MVTSPGAEEQQFHRDVAPAASLPFEGLLHTLCTPSAQPLHSLCTRLFPPIDTAAPLPP